MPRALLYFCFLWVGRKLKNKLLTFTTLLLLSLLLISNAHPNPTLILDDNSSEAGQLTVKTTYNSISLYWDLEIDDTSEKAHVFYKKSSDAEWLQGVSMDYETREFSELESHFNKYELQYRGSLVQLASNTQYDVLTYLESTNSFSISTVTTWSEKIKVAKTILIEPDGEKINITESGSSNSGYVVYDGQNKQFSLSSGKLNNIVINASYIVIRNFNLIGAEKHAIYIDGKNNQSIIIEKNNISQWGRLGNGKAIGENFNSAIANKYDHGYKQKKIIIQDNNIYNPNFSANSWRENPKNGYVDGKTYHPEGPQGITLSNTLGSNVIRRNNIFSTNGNYFNDGMGAQGDNDRPYGFPGPDSDIYENSISHAWDDAFEIEGGNANVRLWQNFTDLNYVSYAVSPAYFGPVYLFRNVAYRHQYSTQHSTMIGTTFKLKTTSRTAGMIHIYHNTQYLDQELNAGANNGLTGSGNEMQNVIALNNAIFVTDNTFIGESGTTLLENNAFLAGTVTNAYLEAYNLEASSRQIKTVSNTAISLTSKTTELAAKFKPKLGSIIMDSGLAIPNFSNGYHGKAPELGANERGSLASVYQHLISFFDFNNNIENSSPYFIPTYFSGTPTFITPSFNGTSYLKLSETDSLSADMPSDDETTEFTITGWFMTDKDSTDKGLIASVTSATSHIYLDINEDGSLRLATKPKGSYYRILKTNNIYNDGNWHHFAIVKGGRDITIWIDGVTDISTKDERAGTYNLKDLTMKNLELSVENIRIYKMGIGEAVIRELVASDRSAKK